MPGPAVLPLLVDSAPGSAAVGGLPGTRSLYLLAAAAVAADHLVEPCHPVVAEALPGTAEAADAAAAVVGEEAGNTAAAAVGEVAAASAAVALVAVVEGVGHTAAAEAADMQAAAADDDTQEGLGSLAAAAADTGAPAADRWEAAAVAHSAGLLHSKLAATVAAAARLARTRTAQQAERQHSYQPVVAAADSLAAAEVEAAAGTAGERASVALAEAARPR